MRHHTPDAIAAAVVAPAIVAAASARPRPVDARPQAHVEQCAPRITNALERVAFSGVSMVLGRRFRRWSERKVGEEARERVSEWEQHDARVCPDPLPSQYFCSSPPRPRWGLGVALEIQGYPPGELRSPWRPFRCAASRADSGLHVLADVLVARRGHRQRAPEVELLVPADQRNIRQRSLARNREEQAQRRPC